MLKPGPIALGAVAWAEDQAARGVHEQGGNNRGPEVERYLRSVGLPAGYAWCAAFVSCALEESAKALGLELPATFPHSAWCPSFEAWAKRSALWLSALSVSAYDAHEWPMRGDMALYFFPAQGRIAHVGLVTEPLLGQSFSSVEGNTSPDKVTGIVRDGDGVYIKRRRLDMLGLRGGFARIPF